MSRPSRPSPRRPIVALASGVVAMLLVLVVSVPTAGADPPVLYRPPVEAPVVDPFRAPTTVFGPGNRGLTYDLPPGTTVRAAADGVVVFAGPVAGALHVTVLHGDGRRTSYSFLDAIDVVRGERVTLGTSLGAAGHGFHFGVREGDVYVDPAGLFGTVEVRVRLVPHDEPIPDTPESVASELRILRWLTEAEKPGIDELVVGTVHGAHDKLAIALELASDLGTLEASVDAVEALWRRYSMACTGGATVTASPASRRVAVLVAGYGSTSAAASIDDVDLAALGYASGDDVRFSYAGGRTPDADGVLASDLAAIGAAAYDAATSMGDLRVSGAALADLIEQVAAAAPGVPVDVFAHSQGGLVARAALLELEARGRLDVLGVVVTIGTPHSGADLATDAAALGPLTADAIADAPVPIDPTATSTLQLGEGSEFITELADRGVPDGVEFRTIGAREDLTVTADKTNVPGFPHTTLDLGARNAHADLPGHPDTTRELQLALAGLPPECDGVADAVLDAVVPEAISEIEDRLGVALLFAP